MRRKREPSASSRIALLLAAAVLGVWAVGMYLLTAMTAEGNAERFVSSNRDKAEGVMGSYAILFERDELTPWNAAMRGALGNPPYRSEEYLRRGNYDKVYGAAAVYDGDGNLLASSAQDYLIAYAYTPERWEAQDQSENVYRLIFFDRDKLTADVTSSGIYEAWKFTGSFVDGEFVPASIEIVYFDDYFEARQGSEYYAVQDVMRETGLGWTEIYTDPDVTGTVTLYSDYVQVNCPERSGELKFSVSDNFRDSVLNGSYSNLDELVLELGDSLGGKPAGWLEEMMVNRKTWDVRYSGWDLVVPSRSAIYTDENGEPFVDHYYYSEMCDYYLVCAVSYSPWEGAIHELAWYYVLSLAAAALLVLIVLMRVRKQLIIPVREVGDALCSDGRPQVLTTYIWRWRETIRLRDGLHRRSDELMKLENERARLSKALDYAKTAEESRRRTVSAVAHELKTPLAVIHSYAEGLREHIAEEKREKYVDVILSETERSDAMVLEMLDYSRLEAGKIKIARDEFSLPALTRAVFEKQEVPAEAKHLQISFDFPDDFKVMADEQRIGEVLENLASNAVKYTPEGGNIKVLIINSYRNCTLTVMNDGEPFTDEQLDKVWEPFYRVDESRTEPGTGLGLAIARSIITLHGGKCIARNTDTGVAFGFILPK